MSDVIAINNKTKPGEPKMTNHKIRNPFPMIGKVFKYEFKNLSRKLFPLFAGMILIGLCLGITAPKVQFLEKENLQYAVERYEESKVLALSPVVIDDNNITTDDSEYEQENKEVFFSSKTTEKIFGFLIIALMIFSITTFVLTIVSTDKRIETSMIKNESYFNFTLPVSIGEHLAGRTITYMVFFIFYGIALVLGILLCGIKYFSVPFFKMVNYGLNEFYINGGGFPNLLTVIILVPLTLLVFYTLFISFAFVEKTLEMNISSHKKFFTFIIEIPVIIIWFRFMFYLSKLSFENGTSIRMPIIGVNIALIIINYIIVYFAFKKHINIE